MKYFVEINNEYRIIGVKILNCIFFFLVIGSFVDLGLNLVFFFVIFIVFFMELDRFKVIYWGILIF